MKKIFPLSAFAISATCISLLLFGCSTSAQSEAEQNKRYSDKLNKAEKSTPSETSESTEQCDFSKYKTLKTRSLKINKLPQPRYPIEAKEKKLSGCVPMKVLVDRKGNVIQACYFNETNSKTCSDRIEDELFIRLSKEAVVMAKFDVSRLKLGDKTYFETVVVYRFTFPQ